MALSGSDVKAFHEGGFFVKRGLFRADEVDTVRAAFERLYATAQTLTATGDHGGSFYALAFPANSAVVVQRVVWAGGSEPALLDLSADPRLCVPLRQRHAFRAGDAHLCAAVNIHMWRDLVRQLRHAHILHDQRIRASGGDLLNRFDCFAQFVVENQGVKGDIPLDPTTMKGAHHVG